MEQWKTITDTNYEISDQGNVRHVNKNTTLTQGLNNGYKQVTLRLNGKSKIVAVHRLVATEFLGNDEGKATVNHINGNKIDNRLANLEWSTQKENVHHSMKTGLNRVRVCPITQFSMDGKEIAKFSSIREIEEKFKYDRSLIIRVCKGKGKSGYGYTWKYTNDDSPVKDEPNGKHYLDYDKYVIVDDGRVFSKKTKKFLKPVKNANGHTYVTFSETKRKKKNFYIHTLVARLYLPNPDNLPTVNHINGIRDDNNVSNLKWVK